MFDIIDATSSLFRTDDLQKLFDNAPAGFFFVHSDGKIRYINQKAGEILGLESHPDVIEYCINDIELILSCGLKDNFDRLKSGRPFKKEEHRCTNCRGHFAVLNIFCNPSILDDGSFGGFWGIIQDVTEWSRQKSDLEKAIRELSIMREVSNALSSASDLDKVLKIILTGITANQGLGFNRAFLFLADERGQYLEGTIAVGPGNPEEAGKIWTRLAEEKITLADLLNDYLEQERNASISLTSTIQGWQIPLNEPSAFNSAITDECGLNVVQSPDLSPLSLEILSRLNSNNIAVAPIISKGRRLGLVAADNQITGKAINDADVRLLQTFANHTAVAIERSQLHENLVEHAAWLEEKNRQIAESQEQIVRIEKMSVIGELTSSIAHELRNPLAIIGGFANLMLASNDNDGSNEYLNIIISESKRAESVLHQVLDFSRASRTQKGKIDFGQLVRNTYDLFVARLKHSRKPPDLLQSEQKIFIWGNRDQLQHAIYQFMNLSVEEMTERCHSIISTMLAADSVSMHLQFQGDRKALKEARQTLSRIFGTSLGSQKLSIIVAGETIKYHGGSLGVEEGRDLPPGFYFELPLLKE